MKKLLLILSFLCGTGALYAQQSIKIELHAGQASYSMTKMKSWQADLKASTRDIPLKTTMAFPGYAYSQATVLFPKAGKRFTLGFWGGFNSTAGRLSYADFSGSATVDHLVRAINFGFIADYPLIEKANHELFVRPRVGIRFSRMTYINQLELGGTYLLNSEEKFNASNGTAGVALGYRYSIGRIYLGAEAGADIDNPNKLLFADDDEKFLVDDFDDPVKVSWSGVRIGLSVGVKLK